MVLGAASHMQEKQRSIGMEIVVRLAYRSLQSAHRGASRPQQKRSSLRPLNHWTEPEAD